MATGDVKRIYGRSDRQRCYQVQLVTVLWEAVSAVDRTRLSKPRFAGYVCNADGLGWYFHVGQWDDCGGVRFNVRDQVELPADRDRRVA